MIVRTLCMCRYIYLPPPPPDGEIPGVDKHGKHIPIIQDTCAVTPTYQQSWVLQEKTTLGQYTMREREFLGGSKGTKFFGNFLFLY